MSVFGVILVRIQSKCGEMRTSITPNTDAFYAVISDLKERYQFMQDDIDEKFNGLNLKVKEVETNLNAIKEKSGYKISVGN